MSQLTEARFYSKRNDAENTVDCFLCNHRCAVKDGQRGMCRVRENRGGKLYTLTYGRLISGNPDIIEKKPLYHFLPGTRAYSIATPGCNFRCPWCQNWQISQTDSHAEFTGIPYTSPEQVVDNAVSTNCKSISYTYTEPTIFMEFALDTARIAKDKGLKNNFVTNGYESPEAVEKMSGLIDAANIDLKSFSEKMYRTECCANLNKVTETIRNMHSKGIHLEITTLIIPGKNDSAKELSDLAHFISGLSPDIPWHVSRFHPDYETTEISPTPEATMTHAIQLGRDAGLNHIYAGNINIPEAVTTKCPQCDHILINRGGLGAPQINISDAHCPQCRRPVNIVMH